MKHFALYAVALALTVAAACSTTEIEVRHEIVSADQAARESLFAPLRALEGRWEGQDPAGAAQVFEFKMSSGGSALREVMFPGSEHEMTNMYSLDGNTIVMTHDCAAGNQPHMRARGQQAGRYEFESDGVSDLKQADEMYMGSMTLVLVDADHIEQHWKALRGDQVDHEMVFKLARVK